MTITLQDTEILDNEISQLENAFIDRHFLTDSEAGELETLIAKAMKLKCMPYKKPRLSNGSV